jgi:peptidoglycan/LPS O-acetylase OafA/YrhL
MDTLTLIPLLAFTLVASLFIYLSIDTLLERGLSFGNLARCLATLALSGLFLLPVAYVLFDVSGQWDTFVGITILLLLAALCALIGGVRHLRRSGPPSPRK